MIHTNKRALILLASYDFSSIHLTLKALNHTLDADETVVVILNGKRCFSAEKVEKIAKEWASENPTSRFVVRPLTAGREAFWAIKEVLELFEPLKNIQYIFKIDDDIIPLNKGWLNNLAQNYYLLNATYGNDINHF